MAINITAEAIFPPGMDPDAEYDSSELLKEMEAEWEKDWAEIDAESDSPLGGA